MWRMATRLEKTTDLKVLKPQKRDKSFYRNLSLKIESGSKFAKLFKEDSYFFVTCRCFCKAVFCNGASVFDFYNSHFQTLIIETLEIDLTLNKFDILRLKVTKILRIFVNLAPDTLIT